MDKEDIRRDFGYTIWPLSSKGGTGVRVSFDPAYDDGPALAASQALERGDWQPAMWLAYTTGQDWDRKAHRVKRLGYEARSLPAVLAWVAAQPGNPDAHLVLAQTLVSVAWEFRGESYAGDVPRKKWQPFFEHLQAADAAALRTIELAPHDPTPWVVLVQTARARQVPRSEFDARWKGLLDRDRFSVAGHYQALQYLCAKWSGSHVEMFAFAEASSAAAPQGSALQVLPLFAVTEYAVEVFGSRVPGAPSYLRYKKGDEVKKALHRAVAFWEGPALASGMPPHASAVFDRTHIAFWAWASGDRALAVRQHRAMGPYSSELPWAYFAPNPRMAAAMNRRLARLVRA